MKVICINDKWDLNPDVVLVKGFPIFGVKYTVIDYNEHPAWKRIGYELEELDPGIFWDSSHFAECDEDENELVEELVEESVIYV